MRLQQIADIALTDERLSGFLHNRMNQFRSQRTCLSQNYRVPLCLITTDYSACYLWFENSVPSALLSALRQILHQFYCPDARFTSVSPACRKNSFIGCKANAFTYTAWQFFAQAIGSRTLLHGLEQLVGQHDQSTRIWQAHLWKNYRGALIYIPVAAMTVLAQGDPNH